MRKAEAHPPAAPTIQVIERLFSLMDVLASREDAISLKEISEKTGLHRQTVLQYFQYLEKARMIKLVNQPERYTGLVMTSHQCLLHCLANLRPNGN